jgi:hypothetical protein
MCPDRCGLWCQDDPVHITTTEAALAGIVISGALTWVASLSVQRATQTRDHLARMWEHRAATYEAVMIQAYEKSSHRLDMMSLIDSITDLKSESGHIESSVKESELTARVLLYGNERVRHAYGDWWRAESSWWKAYKRIFADVPDCSNLDFRAEARIRAEEASKAAEKAQGKLMYSVTNAIQQVPKRNR